MNSFPCNPSYSGDRTGGSWLDPAQAKKKKKRAGRVAQVVGPEFKPQYHQKKKKRKKVLG
jgi:hypothetical protein